MFFFHKIRNIPHLLHIELSPAVEVPSPHVDTNEHVGDAVPRLLRGVFHILHSP